MVQEEFGEEESDEDEPVSEQSSVGRSSRPCSAGQQGSSATRQLLLTEVCLQGLVGGYQQTKQNLHK